jgi:hypothetical protein
MVPASTTSVSFSTATAPRARSTRTRATQSRELRLRSQVEFTHWGKHQASNRWADVPNVILAGTLFMRPSLYTALTRLAQGKPPGFYKLPSEDIQRTTVGEHKDLLLQAICRGRVRKLDGDKCKPMHAYVIASPVSGIPRA